GGDCLADVGKGAAADLTCADFRTEGEYRNVLARVVRAAPGGIAAVVRGDDGEVAGLELRLQRRQLPVEGFERSGVTGNVTAVTEHHVEIDEIDHRQIAVTERIEDTESL